MKLPPENLLPEVSLIRLESAPMSVTFDKSEALRVFRAMWPGGYRQRKLVVKAKNDELEFIGNEIIIRDD